MILLLILLVLVAIACKIFLGMVMEVIGAILGFLFFLIIYCFRKKRKVK